MKINLQKDFKVSRYKEFNIGLIQNENADIGWCWFDIGATWSRKQDHAGLNANIEIFGICFFVHINDTRHWDDEKNKFRIY